MTHLDEYQCVWVCGCIGVCGGGGGSGEEISDTCGCRVPVRVLCWCGCM